MAQPVKRLPAMWETWVWSLGQKDPLQEKMTTHSSILAWKIPWMKDPGGLQSMGLQRVRHDWAISLIDVVMKRKSQKKSSTLLPKEMEAQSSHF